jgi:hypothetical protein
LSCSISRVSCSRTRRRSPTSFRRRSARARRAAGWILAKPGDFLKKALKTLGLDQVLSIQATVDDAVKALQV